MPKLANQSFSAPPSYERSAVDNGEFSERWTAEPAQGQDDPVEYSCPRLPRHTQKLDAPVLCTTFSPLRWSCGVGPTS